jgi:Neuraminidase (sialidase)
MRSALAIILLSASAFAQPLEVTERRAVAASRDVHYAFPRLIRAKSGDLLLFYKVATSHASDPSVMVMRRSKDQGASWSEPQEIHRDPQPDHAATNTVPLVLPGGRILDWLSSYAFSKQARREPTFWNWSDDDGKTWSPIQRFDTDPSRSTYYVTDAILTSDGMLACAATFPPTFAGNCWAVIWHSKDGKKWTVRSNLTSPKENRGDEVALLETSPGTILCLLRARQASDNPLRKGLPRFLSKDGGRTWTELENLQSQLDCTLQRPFLTRLDRRTVLLSGRDYDRKLVVAYVSRDNGQTFGERTVIDKYVGDGAYTAAVPIGPDTVRMVYYSDVDSALRMPDIFSVKIRVPAKRSTPSK